MTALWTCTKETLAPVLYHALEAKTLDQTLQNASDLVFIRFPALAAKLQNSEGTVSTVGNAAPHLWVAASLNTRVAFFTFQDDYLIDNVNLGGESCVQVHLGRKSALEQLKRQAVASTIRYDKTLIDYRGMNSSSENWFNKRTQKTSKKICHIYPHLIVSCLAGRSQ